MMNPNHARQAGTPFNHAQGAQSHEFSGGLRTVGGPLEKQ
jgi:hypothetical protein